MNNVVNKRILALLSIYASVAAIPLYSSDDAHEGRSSSPVSRSQVQAREALLSLPLAGSRSHSSAAERGSVDSTPCGGSALGSPERSHAVFSGVHVNDPLGFAALWIGSGARSWSHEASVAALKALAEHTDANISEVAAAALAGNKQVPGITDLDNSLVSSVPLSNRVRSLAVGTIKLSAFLISCAQDGSAELLEHVWEHLAESGIECTQRDIRLNSEVVKCMTLIATEIVSTYQAAFLRTLGSKDPAYMVWPCIGDFDCDDIRREVAEVVILDEERYEAYMVLASLYLYSRLVEGCRQYNDQKEVAAKFAASAGDAEQYAVAYAERTVLDNGAIF